MPKVYPFIAIIMFSIFLLNGCSNTSFSKESKAAEQTVKTTFTKEKPNKPNKSNGKYHFYLPFGFEVKNSDPNNIILKNGTKTYILFINPKETSSSDIVYKASVAKYKKLEVNESDKKNNKLVYILIHRLKDDNNELTVGIGGNKMTTETRTSNLKAEAKLMMKIVNSVKITK